MKKEIPYPLSVQSKPYYVAALAKVEQAKQAGGKVVDVKLTDDGKGNPVGVIVMDVPVPVSGGN